MSISFRSLGPVVALLLTATACVNTERDIASSSATRTSRTEFTPPRGRGERVGGTTVLNTVQATHPFSDPKSADTFILQLRGPRILSGRLHLVVLSSQGDTLRYEVMPATALIDDPTLRDNQSASVRDKEVSILRGMNNFFSDKHFAQPALPATATPPAGVSSQAWASLRNDPAAVGFDYASPAGERRLVYSRQLAKVLVVNDYQ
ncbi:hypothetical protein [Hymenobacter arcticus]